MIQLIFNGHLGKDAELKQTQNGDIVVFNVANTIKWTDKTTNERKEKTTWVSCVSRQVALLQWLKKGTGVLIQGSPSVNAYLNKENQADAMLQCNVERLDFIGSAPTQQAPQQQTQQPTQTMQYGTFDTTSRQPVRHTEPQPQAYQTTNQELPF